MQTSPLAYVDDVFITTKGIVQNYTKLLVFQEVQRLVQAAN